HGWEYFAARRSIAPWPQREAWAWACYLWLYDKTRYQPLLDQARNALRMTMQRYPDGWGNALHEMQMERGRIRTRHLRGSLLNCPPIRTSHQA
ncbi:MAG: hypothetical protein GY878_05145, partial [Fuerstiella sp.]|nr:hypothetical protein [Fuerstiella sp.]